MIFKSEYPPITMEKASICVAMDFPGWLEAATTVFFLSGRMRMDDLVDVH